MGHYSTLYIGNFLVASQKYGIPLESWLMFTRDDFQIVIEYDDSEDDKAEFDYYKFITTAERAKNRLDTRGINLTFCKELYEEFRAKDIDFDNYLYTLSRIFLEKKERYFPSQYDYPHKWEDDSIAKWVATNEIFNGHATSHFKETIQCILIRSFLEVVPEDTPITFDLTDLVWSGFISPDDFSSIFDYYMSTILRRIELDYKIYGFVIEDDPLVDTKLRDRIMNLNEDQFIFHVLYPLLEKMGYRRVRKVNFHGPSEFGSDVLPLLG